MESLQAGYHCNRLEAMSIWKECLWAHPARPCYPRHAPLSWRGFRAWHRFIKLDTGDEAVEIADILSTWLHLQWPFWTNMRQLWLITTLTNWSPLREADSTLNRMSPSDTGILIEDNLKNGACGLHGLDHLGGICTNWPPLSWLWKEPLAGHTVSGLPSWVANFTPSLVQTLAPPLTSPKERPSVSAWCTSWLHLRKSHRGPFIQGQQKWLKD